MSDIVDRLRKGPAPIDDPDLNDDAADTIEAQAEHIRVLREALGLAEPVLHLVDAAMPFPVAKAAIQKARAALEKTK